MQIVLFTHPGFTVHQSMPRYTNMLANGLRMRGHTVDIYAPEAYFSKVPAPAFIRKWLGYIDQFLIFPAVLKKRIKKRGQTLYVFTDQALGMWVPVVKHLPHLVICHDFLAQRSAIGEIPENPTGWSGKIYQRLIRNGYSQGKNFVSVSKNTQRDLHRFLGFVPSVSEVVYNGLNNDLVPLDTVFAREIIRKKIGVQTLNGYVLHVGGNQWYKNRIGIVAIYNAWRAMYSNALPLLLIGLEPAPDLLQEIELSSFKEDIFALTNIDDDDMNAAYSGASVLLFPSLAEGFGWPIAEAMASGCPVITTGEPPMTEVGNEAAVYIPRRPLNPSEIDGWTKECAEILNKMITLGNVDLARMISKGLDNARRFNREEALNRIEHILLEAWDTCKDNFNEN